MISSSSGSWPRALHPVLQSSDVTVVIRTPDVDQQVVAAGELVAVIGDVGQQVRGLAVGLDEHAVLVVAEVGGAQPDRTVGVVHLAAGAQVVERRLDGVAVDQRLLAEPDVELDAHAGQRGREVAPHPLVAPFRRVGAVGHLRRPFLDVVPLVSVRGNGLTGFGGGERLGEQAHLRATVVQVVLAGHRVAAPLEDVAERIAVRRPAATAGVQRARRVGGDELDVDPRAAPDVVAGVAVLAVGDDVRQHGGEPRGPQVEVHEAGAGELDPLDVRRRVGGQLRGEGRGELPRRATGLLGRGQGHVRRPIAVLAPRRPLELHGRGRVDADGHEGVAHGPFETFTDHGWTPAGSAGSL